MFIKVTVSENELHLNTVVVFFKRDKEAER